jgi:hypothetical protein
MNYTDLKQLAGVYLNSAKALIPLHSQTAIFGLKYKYE